MIFKVLFKNGEIKMNDEDIYNEISKANTNEEIDQISNNFSAFLASFNEHISHIVEQINDKKENLNNISGKDQNSMNFGGRVKTMTPPSGGVRRVNHSNLPINYDNQGFVPVKVLIICSIVVTLVMYGILLITNLK